MAVALISLTLALPFGGGDAGAQGSVGISGTFYQQSFDLPQGGSAGGRSVYLTVFNQGNTDFEIQMSYEAPAGVSVSFSEQGFPLKAGENVEVYLTVNVSKDAVPGEYRVHVVAEAHAAAPGGGMQIIPAGGQTASLVVRGSSAVVALHTVGAEGEPLAATLRLFKVASGRENEVASSDTGDLEARVTPGSFVARAYVSGYQAAEERFEVGADEQKAIVIEASAVYFKGFFVVPVYRDDGELSLARIELTLNNLYRPLSQARFLLRIERGEETPEEVTLASLSLLQEGETSLTYNYAPARGWQPGVYRFGLRLLSGDKVFASASERELEAGLASPTAAPLSPVRVNVRDRIDDSGAAQQPVVVVSSDSQARVEIPEETRVLTSRQAPPEWMEVKAPEGSSPAPAEREVVGRSYDFGPDGVTFDPPVEVRIAYDPASLPAGVAPEQLAVGQYTEGTGWLELDSQVDAAAHTVSARVSHFTVFAILAPQHSPGGGMAVTLILALGVAGVLGGGVAVYVLRQRRRAPARS